MSAEVSDHPAGNREAPVSAEIAEEGLPIRDEKPGRALLALLGLVGVGALGTAIVYDRFIRDEPAPPPQTAIIGESKVDCSRMIDLFEPTTADEVIASRGEPLRFMGREPSHALKKYYDNRSALLAFACKEIVSQSTDDMTGQLYSIHVENVPVIGTDNMFEIHVSLGEAG